MRENILLECSHRSVTRLSIASFSGANFGRRKAVAKAEK